MSSASASGAENSAGPSDVARRPSMSRTSTSSTRGRPKKCRKTSFSADHSHNRKSACVFCPNETIKISREDIRYSKRKRSAGVSILKSSLLLKKVRKWIPDYQPNDARYPCSICLACQRRAIIGSKKFERHVASAVARAQTLKIKRSGSLYACDQRSCYICSNVQTNQSTPSHVPCSGDKDAVVSDKRRMSNEFLALSSAMGVTTSDRYVILIVCDGCASILVLLLVKVLDVGLKVIFNGNNFLSFPGRCRRALPLQFKAMNQRLSRFLLDTCGTSASN